MILTIEFQSTFLEQFSRSMRQSRQSGGGLRNTALYPVNWDPTGIKLPLFVLL